MPNIECVICGKVVDTMQDRHWEFIKPDEVGVNKVNVVCSKKCLDKYMNFLEKEETPEEDER